MHIRPVIKKWFSKGNIFNLLFVALLALFIFSTSVRVWVISGVMKTGIFNPALPVDKVTGTPAGEVLFRDGSGMVIALSSLKGKVVFINFWATWCPPCIAEMPSINALYTRLKGNAAIVFLMVDSDGDLSRSMPFMQRHGLSLPVYILASPVPRSMMGNAIPATVVIDKQGNIVLRHDGMADYASPRFEKFLVTLTAR